MTKVLECLKKHGQRLDLEIARETGVPLATVREQLASLAATGAIVACSLTRFESGKRTDALQCRMSGYVPPQAPGRKAKVGDVVLATGVVHTDRDLGSGYSYKVLVEEAKLKK